MIAPKANDGKGLRALRNPLMAITDLLMESYCCPISDRGAPSCRVWWRQLPQARSR